MYFWGLTINMVSCIDIVLAIGLCVDYASHIGKEIKIKWRILKAHEKLTRWSNHNSYFSLRTRIHDMCWKQK